MLSRKHVYKIILCVLHFVFSMVVWLNDFVVRVKEKLIADAKQDGNVAFLSENLRTVTKIPKHLIVNLSDEEPSFKDLANMVLWSAASGIPFLSFYDYRGQLKEHSEELYKEVQVQNRHNFKIMWPQRQRGAEEHRNGYAFKTSVKILSFLDSHKKVVNLTKDFSVQSVKSDMISAETINKYLEEWPEPDLVLYCGDFCSTFGCPPWELRVTEFLNLPSHCNLSVEWFVKLLKVYSKCEQRLGK